MSAQGAFTFVLHSHLPYARLAGRWPHGEEWIHEAAVETYIPLLQALYDLKEEGVQYKLTIGITPILAEQLADADVLRNLDLYIEDKLERAARDVERFGKGPSMGRRGKYTDDDEEEDDLDDDFEDDDDFDDDFEDDDLDDDFDDDDLEDDDDFDDDEEELFNKQRPPTEGVPLPWWERHRPEALALATTYQNFFEGTQRALTVRFRGDLIGAFRRLQDEGYIEITTSAATHGYLPLLGTDSAIRAQLATGVRSYRRHFGRDPRGIWLPECAYRPAFYADDKKIRPGLEKFIAEQGLQVFFTETHLVTGGLPVGMAEGDIMGAYGVPKRRYLIPLNAVEGSGTTMRAYWVADSANKRATMHSGTAVIARNNRLGEQVWSASHGYPGDGVYREFHRKDEVSGLQYWRVTGPGVALGAKELWHPEWAQEKVEQHARHFCGLVEEEITGYHQETGEYGIVACNYDTELFGHWWAEGVAWLKQVLRTLAQNPKIALTTASEFIAQHPPAEWINLPEGSWGSGGAHYMWDNEDTHWMWEPIHDAEAKMQQLADAYAEASDPDVTAVLSQAARELLLMESSDWPFLVTTGQARQYAVQRFATHSERFIELARGLEMGQPDSDFAARLWEMDKVYPDIDFRDWASR